MNKIKLIIQREYSYRVRKKSFLLLTLLTPLLFSALIFVPLWLSTFKNDETRQVAVIDATGKYAPLFRDTDRYRFIAADRSLAEYQQKKLETVFAVLNITGDLLESPDQITLYSEKQIPSDLKQLIDQTLNRYLEQEKLNAYGIPDIQKIISDSKTNFQTTTVKWGSDGSTKISSAVVAESVGLILTTLIFFFILTYGGMVIQSVTEEKSNRIVELMVSSVRPFQLMMGKIIGIGLVGLTQLFFWGVLTCILVAGSRFLFFPGSADPDHTSLGRILIMFQSLDFTQIGIFFVLNFIGGYLLYAALLSALGSAVDTPEDTQQFMMPVTMLLLFSFYAGIYSMKNPDGPLAVWCSFIPFTSPIVMMVRLPFDMPLWQIALSEILLFGSAAGIVWFSAKIYRVGILMYGKKPSIKEIIKWSRYK